MEVWYIVKKRVRICPQCGSDKVVPVIYGMPTSELDDDEKAGKVRLGGCCVSLDSPDLACNNCGLKWSDQDHGCRDYNDIKNIHAYVGGYVGFKYEIEIDFINGKTLWRKSESYSVEEEKEKRFNKKDLNKFVAGLEKCNLFNWRYEYYCPACDGTQWNVEINFENMAMIKTGSNDYPGQWGEFCS